VINDTKTILQVSCLAVLLIVLILAGLTLYRFNIALEDFRESFIFQPAGSIGSLSVESLAPEMILEKVEDLPSLPGVNAGDQPGDVLESFDEVERPKIPGFSVDSEDSEPDEVNSIQESELLPEESSASTPEVKVDSGNICNRTPEIQEILIDMLEIKSCRDITGEELVRVRQLNLREIPLKVGDLDGFINLTDLTVQTDEAALGLLDDLVNLKRLGMAVKIPPSLGLFQKLASLQELSLVVEVRKDAESLSLEGVFEGLDDLEHLELETRAGSDGLSVTLSTGSLVGMPKLQQLQVSNVNRIESGVFSDLPALRAASLQAIDLPDHLSKP